MKKINEKGFTVIELMTILTIVFCFGGWIANIVKVIDIASDPVTGLFILRCIGIVFAPLGVILGFC